LKHLKKNRLLLIIIILFFWACAYNNKDYSNELEQLKKYAEEYQVKYRQHKDSFPDLPILSNELKVNIEKLTKAKKKEHLKYLLLICNKHHLFYLQNFHQSYEVKRNNFIIKSIFKIVSFKYRLKYFFRELLLTDDIYEITKEHIKLYNNYKPLIEIIKEIKKAEKDIENGIFWK